MRGIFFTLLVVLLSIQSSLAYFPNDRRIMAGITINKNGPDFYLQYKEQSDYNKFFNSNIVDNNTANIKISLNNNLYTSMKKYNPHYEGYKNVEGYENNKRKNDVRFAAIVISIGLFTVAAGAFTIAALIDAIDD